MVNLFEVVGIGISVVSLGISVKFIVDSIEGIIGVSMVITAVVGIVGIQYYPGSQIFKAIFQSAFILLIMLVIVIGAKNA